MNLSEIVQIIEAKVFTHQANLDQQIIGGCAADLMSDVLATAQPHAILFTGLCTTQVIRTAQMADVSAIAFVRGKQPSKEMIEMADMEGIPLISSPHGMFELCGRLFEAGLCSLEASLQCNDE